MEQQLQQEVVPSSAEAPLSVKDGVSTSIGERTATQEAREAEIKNIQDGIRAAARAKMEADLRVARGIPEPAPAAAPVARQDAPQATQPAATTPSVSPDVTQALMQAMQAQAALVEQQKAQAAQVTAEAQARMAAAEAKERELAKVALNPVEFLERTGISLDEWQARLLNGGEETLEQRKSREILEATKATQDRVAKLEAQLQQQVHTAQRQATLAQLKPALEADFPVVAAFLGPDRALDALAQTARQGKQIDAKAFFAEMETNLISQQKALLSNNAVQAKLGLGVKSPQSEVAAQSPKTLDNRATSTVGSRSQAGPMSERERLARGRAMLKQLFADPK